MAMGDRPTPALPIPMVLLLVRDPATPTARVLPMEVRRIPMAPDQHPEDLPRDHPIPTAPVQHPVREVLRDRVIPTAPVRQADRQAPVPLQVDHPIPTALVRLRDHRQAVPALLRGVLRRPVVRLRDPVHLVQVHRPRTMPTVRLMH